MDEYTYLTSSNVADHADHAWEDWHAYLSADRPGWTTGEDAGICCHTCRIVVVQR